MKFLLLLLTLASAFAQTRTNIMEQPATNYIAGTTNTFSNFTARGRTNIIVSLSRESWPRAATAARLESDISINGGITWVTNVHTLTTTGGTLTNKQGQTRTNSLAIRSLDPSQTNLVRTRLVVLTNLTTRVEVK